MMRSVSLLRIVCMKLCACMCVCVYFDYQFLLLNAKNNQYYFQLSIQKKKNIEILIIINKMHTTARELFISISSLINALICM